MTAVRVVLRHVVIAALLPDQVAMRLFVFVGVPHAGSKLCKFQAYQTWNQTKKPENAYWPQGQITAGMLLYLTKNSMSCLADIRR